jgi:hypothetical protein
MRRVMIFLSLVILGLFPVVTANQANAEIVHDAEYYILDAQNGEKWKAEDGELDKKIEALRKKHGRPPNLIHIMWDDTAYGDVGIPAIQKVRGLETPNIHAYQESAHKFEKNDFLAVSKPNIRFLRFLALVCDEHIPLFSRILPGY